MLGGLFVTPTATAIGEALQSAKITGGRIAVASDARLARALGAAGREIVPVGLSARAAARLPGAVAEVAALEPGSLDAAIVVGMAASAAWESELAAWCRLVRDGGAVVLVDRARAPLASCRALCAGLCELEQRHAGRTVVTSGLVTAV